MSYIDAHAHLDFKEFDTDRDQVIDRAQKAGVEIIINAGTNLARSLKSIELANKYTFIYATIGIHPHDVGTELQFPLQQLKEMTQNQKVIGIGEVGLDYYRKLSPKEKQIDFLKAFIELSLELNKPLILHCRDAFDDMLKILDGYPQARGVSHCFLGSWDIAQEFIKRGFLISFTGAVTYPGKNHDELVEVIKNVPLNSFLTETDAPYLAPIPYRGTRNEPAYVVEVTKYIAEIKDLKAKEIGNHALNNAKRLFKLEVGSTN